MKPVPFDQVNKTFTAPPGMEESCGDLPVWQGRDTDGTPLIISCWELTKEEIIQIANTGRVYLSVVGTQQPPVSVMAESPFVNETEEA